MALSPPSQFHSMRSCTVPAQQRSQSTGDMLNSSPTFQHSIYNDPVNEPSRILDKQVKNTHRAGNLQYRQYFNVNWSCAEKMRSHRAYASAISRPRLVLIAIEFKDRTLKFSVRTRPNAALFSEPTQTQLNKINDQDRVKMEGQGN